MTPEEYDVMPDSIKKKYAYNDETGGWDQIKPLTRKQTELMISIFRSNNL